MKTAPLLTTLLVLAAAMSGCNRSLDDQEVREFVDRADEAARKRYAPEICGLRGESFTLELRYQPLASREEPKPMTLSRQLFCREAGKFARLYQYRLERESLTVSLADDRKTAKVVAEYVETLPYYGDGGMPATPDNFSDFVIVRSRDESTVGIEGGDLVFLDARVSAQESELVPKHLLNLPYD